MKPLLILAVVFSMSCFGEDEDNQTAEKFKDPFLFHGYKGKVKTVTKKNMKSNLISIWHFSVEGLLRNVEYIDFRGVKIGYEKYYYENGVVAKFELQDPGGRSATKYNRIYINDLEYRDVASHDPAEVTAVTLNERGLILNRTINGNTSEYHYSESSRLLAHVQADTIFRYKQVKSDSSSNPKEVIETMSWSFRDSNGNTVSGSDKLAFEYTAEYYE